MRLSRAGLAIFSSSSCFQGDSAGHIAVLNASTGNEAGWLTDALWGRQAPDDPRDPEHSPWSIVDGAGTRLLPGWPFVRFGGGVAAGSHNGAGQIRWADGSIQDFSCRLVGISADGIVLVTDGNHRTLTFYERGLQIDALEAGGIIQQSNAQESDQLDAQLVNGWLTFRTEHGTQLWDFTHLEPVGDYLPNPYARTTIPLDNGTLVEWDGQRTTWRPRDSRMGLVLRDEPSDFFYLDAVEVNGDLILVGSLGAGQLAGDYRAYLFPDFESLPRVDVITPPVPSGYPYTAMPAPIDIFYYFYQHAQDSQGAPFETPPDVPCHACMPLTWGELQMANAAKMPVFVNTDGTNLTIGSIERGTFRIIQRSDIYSLKGINGNPDEATKRVCQREGVTLRHYQDTPNPVVPAGWPEWGVFACQCYFEFNQAPDVFVPIIEARLKALLASGVKYLDVTFSGYDRNRPDPDRPQPWTPDLIRVLQSCAGEICRRVPQVVSVAIFDGGRWGILVGADGTVFTIGGSYLHNLIPEHLKLKACIPAGPSRWPLPPEDDDMKARLTTWAEIEPELRLACHAAGFDQPTTDAWVRTDYDRWAYSPAIPQPEWGLYTVPRMLCDILKLRRIPTLTEAQCVDAAGNPRTVNEILAVVYPRS